MPRPSKPRIPRSRPSLLASVLLAGAALLGLGCKATLGPTTVPQARFDYNRAVARSWDEQLLLNLVRLRYRDTPHFLELTSVVAQYSRSGSLGIGGLLIDGGDTETSLGVDVEVAERPTLTLTPLEGKDFVQRLLKPLAPTDLVLLSQAGWSIFRLMQCCVQEVLGPDGRAVRNALRAAGPTPVLLRRDEYQEFQTLSRRLRNLQVAGALRATIESRPAADGSPGEEEVLLLLEQTTETTEDLAFVRRTLGLGSDTSLFRLVSHRAPGPGEVSVVGRSLMSVLFFLSQAVEAPTEDVAGQRVTLTRDEAGQPVDWNRVTGDLLRIRYTEERPASAAVGIAYRGGWFYIDDGDLQSKSTFLLLSQLFSLQAGSTDGRSPLLTVSAGGG